MAGRLFLGDLPLLRSRVLWPCLGMQTTHRARPLRDWASPPDVTLRIYGHQGLEHHVICRALRQRLGTDLALPVAAML
jgi:hypothetical protein